jgi:hypothetical protein
VRIEEFVTVIKARADASVTSARMATEKLSASILGAARAAGAFGAAVGAVTLAASRAADAAIKGARALGIESEEYQTLAVVADRAGTSIGALTRASRALAAAQLAARSGSGAQAQAFRAIGVSAVDAQGKLRSFSDLLPDILDGLSKVESQQERTALASVLLGRGSQEMASLIAAGGEAMRRAQERARELGYVFTDATGKAAERLNDNLADLQMSFRALAFRAVAPLIPLLADATDGLVDWWTEQKRAIDGGLDRYIGGLVKAFRDLDPRVRSVIGVLAAGTTLGALARVALGFASMFGALAGPKAAAAVGSLGLLGAKLALVAGAVALIGLGLDDVRGFLAGEESVTGDILSYFGGADAVEAGRKALGALGEVVGAVASGLGAMASAAGRATSSAASGLAGWLSGLADSVSDYPLVARSIREVADALRDFQSVITPTALQNSLAGNLNTLTFGLKGSAQAWREFTAASARVGYSTTLPMLFNSGTTETRAPTVRQQAEALVNAARNGTLVQNITVNAPGATPSEAAMIARETVRREEAAFYGSLGLPVPR